MPAQRCDRAGFSLFFYAVSSPIEAQGNVIATQNGEIEAFCRVKDVFDIFKDDNYI